MTTFPSFIKLEATSYNDNFEHLAGLIVYLFDFVPYLDTEVNKNKVQFKRNNIESQQRECLYEVNYDVNQYKIRLFKELGKKNYFKWRIKL